MTQPIALEFDCPIMSDARGEVVQLLRAIFECSSDYKLRDSGAMVSRSGVLKKYFDNKLFMALAFVSQFSISAQRILKK
jgi:hypothetical protein